MTVSDFSSCFDDGKFFPPGFRFHPTDEELVLYYLKRKMCRRRLKLDIIGETDVYKWDPEELPGLSKLKTGDRQWFFFSPRDRKYPNGARSNRATLHGYWKATGKDRTISCNSRSVGVKKTLVFYSGRAPAGIRTDWVMHEYTLDEEELKRCESAKDYYALYKVYKKSGPGPKNGEQYGAPFKEEEWADDECLEVDAPVMEGDKVISVENAKDDYDFDEFLKRIADEEPVLDPQLGVLNQLFVEEEANSTLVGGTQSGVSQFQFYEGPEVTSGPGQQGTHLAEEDFLEDFLEMDDLIGPEPNVQNFKDPMENSLFDEMSRLNEVGLFQDPSVLCEVGPTGPGEILQQYMQNQNENSFSYNINSGAKDYTLNGESNAVPNPYLTNESQIDDQIWTQDQRRSVFTPTEANQGVIPPLSGAVYDCNLANIPNQIGNASVNEDDSWFSSALWSWLESVPTDTASAAENPISNGACMGSSNTIRNDTTTGTAPKRLDRSKSVFLCFLILGIFCAMLSVLIRTTMNVSGRYIY